MAVREYRMLKRAEGLDATRERIVEEPGETNVNPSDLDPDRDFVISTTR